MRVVFAGTPGFAVPALHALNEGGHDVTLVLTQPDRPAGRGLDPAESAVKRAAVALGLPVFQPTTLSDPAARTRLHAAAPEILVVAAYGLILPQAVLDVPDRGAVNIHASLLPRWRGAAPIQRAILAGDPVTGVSIMQMDAGLDTGPVLMRAEAAITPEDTTGTLHDRLAVLGAALLLDALKGILAGTIAPVPQATDGVTYARKIEKSEARIDWTGAAATVDRQIRAFNPFPGAVAQIRDTQLKVWRAALGIESGQPGMILRAGAEGIVVACGVDSVILTELQRAGGKRLSAGELLRGFPLASGERFTTAHAGLGKR
ncbi:MAG: methionyl-tRNA formyltransferase [Betaproteobacteria bacterium]|jgi:methionyl-tRNA formyltransferase|nr:methionyl-tRNA formyltransferase [Betaproteobacteria bacterium]